MAMDVRAGDSDGRFVPHRNDVLVSIVPKQP